MPGKRIKYQLVKQHRSYAIDEIARLLNVHKNTVRHWVKQGLPLIDESKPILILGVELKDWLAAKRKSAKRPCGPGEFFCLKCKSPKRPALEMVDYLPKNETSGCLRAFCEACERPVNRNARIADLHHVMPGIAIQFVEHPSSLTGRADRPSNSDLE